MILKSKNKKENNIINNIIKYYWEYKYYLTYLIYKSYNKSNINIEKPIFLLGTQGGGLTLISRMIRRNRQVITISGNYNYWTGVDELDKHFKSLPEEIALRSPGYKNVNKEHFNHPIFGYERSWIYASNALIEYYRKTEEDYTEQIDKVLKSIIKRCIIAYSLNQSTARFLDMSQSFTLKIPLINKIFPDAKFILISRNPYVMCHREVTKNINKYKNFNKEISKEDALRLSAEHWANSYAIAIKDLHDINKGYVVQFEDFLENPKDELSKAVDYLDLEFTEDMLPQSQQKLPLGSKEKLKWYPIKSNINDDYLEKISKKEISIINGCIKDVAPKIGYNII